jgi:hypothetical protein
VGGGGLIWFGSLKIPIVATQDLFLIVIDFVTKLFLKMYAFNNVKINV